MKRFGLSKEDSTMFGMSIFVYQRSAFLTLFMFQVENLLKMIRNNLPNLSKSEKYYDVCKDVLSVTHPSNTQEKHEILQCPALMRNCLHTSGVHTKANVTVTVNGTQYNFTKNQMFNSGGWDSIYAVLDSLVDVIYEIFNDSNVKKTSNKKMKEKTLVDYFFDFFLYLFVKKFFNNLVHIFYLGV